MECGCGNQKCVRAIDLPSSSSRSTGGSLVVDIIKSGTIHDDNDDSWQAVFSNKEADTAAAVKDESATTEEDYSPKVSRDKVEEKENNQHYGSNGLHKALRKPPEYNHHLYPGQNNNAPTQINNSGNNNNNDNIAQQLQQLQQTVKMILLRQAQQQPVNRTNVFRASVFNGDVISINNSTRLLCANEKGDEEE